MENKRNKLFMIGSSHLDPVWLWQWYDGYHEALATFRSALDRMKEYDGFIFTGCSAVYYTWVEETDPAMFEEIKNQIAEGRWVLAGGWWVQPDCNIPSGESFARQALYSQRYFLEKFGKTAHFGFNVDSFGHVGTLPQILKLGGLDSYVFSRPQAAEKGLPAEHFLWESNDGTCVDVFRIAYGYGSDGGGLDGHIKTCAEGMDKNADISMCFYGIGNHGGGPTKENIESIMKLAKDASLPEIVFASPDDYFKAARDENRVRPVVHDDIYHHASGCYSSHSGIKALNRRAEYTLLPAEALCVLADAAAGIKYPADFARAWQNVLFNQFHDIMGGTSIKEAYVDAEDQLREAISIGARNQNRAAQAIAWRIGIPYESGVFPIVVFNGAAVPAKVPVSVLPVDFNVSSLGNYRLLDDSDTEIPVQATKNGFKKNLNFIADLPALGYRTYRLVPGSPKGFEDVRVDGLSSDNGRLRLEIDPKTGFINGLFDEKGVNQFMRPSARPCAFEDSGNAWGHRVWVYDSVPAGGFVLESAELIEKGPVLACVRVSGTLLSSRVTQEFIIYKDIDRIDVKFEVDWHEKDRMLKIMFDTTFVDERIVASSPFGFANRPFDGVEFPMHEWLDISGVPRGRKGIAGLAILNNGKYSYSVRHNHVGLTVLRSPIYAQHTPTSPGVSYAYMDQGVQCFSYSLFPHKGGLETGCVQSLALAFNTPPFALFATYHDGPLPQSLSFLSCSMPNVAVTCVKNAEDGEGLIIRAFETAKIDVKGCVISLPVIKREICADFRPCEIKTFYIPRDSSLPVREVNFFECEAAGR